MGVETLFQVWVQGRIGSGCLQEGGAVSTAIPAKAVGGKPKGAQELAGVMGGHIRPETMVISDGWRRTKGACGKLKVSHKTAEHRDTFLSDEGYHSNDAASEISRFRRWVRAKYGSCWTGAKGEHGQRLQGILAEYQLFSNHGSQMVIDLKLLLQILLQYTVPGSFFKKSTSSLTTPGFQLPWGLTLRLKELTSRTALASCNCLPHQDRKKKN